ncbi:MAG: esterase [Bacteroidaceae bacterium]|nr:esterase [Bacteroidaceae bacterium]
MKRTITVILTLAALITANSALAQGQGGQRLTPQLMAQLFPQGVKSPEYNSDGSVTFRCQAADAQKVELECQMFSGNRPMTRNERGVWEITVTPDQPDIYPYCFVIDGTQVADPNNMFIFPNEGFKYSLADVRGEAPSMQDMQQVPHGKVSYRYYHSKQLGFDRPLCVYTPAGYDPAGKEKLPVLYLIHGMTDTYETWFKVGRVNIIMDNLIAQGLAKRMIIVMPYANPNPEIQARGLNIPQDIMGTDVFCKEITEEVIPFIESNYNVLTKADNRAIAGFSLGGRQTLACGFGNPDKFHYVCAYAPAIFGNEYETNFQNGTYAPIKDLQKKLKLMWLGTGSDDFLIQASRGLDSYLTEQGLKHTFYNPGGGHTWMNCRDYIELTAKELFK